MGHSIKLWNTVRLQRAEGGDRNTANSGSLKVATKQGREHRKGGSRKEEA